MNDVQGIHSQDNHDSIQNDCRQLVMSGVELGYQRRTEVSLRADDPASPSVGQFNSAVYGTK